MAYLLLRLFERFRLRERFLSRDRDRFDLFSRSRSLRSFFFSSSAACSAGSENFDGVRYLSVTEKMMTPSPDDALSHLKVTNNYGKKRI